MQSALSSSSSSFITQEAAQKMQTQTHKNSHKNNKTMVVKKENMMKKHDYALLLVRLSVCLSVTRLDQSKTVMQLSPQSIAEFPIVFYGISLVHKFWQVPPERGRQTRVWRENRLFSSSFMRRYVENGTRYDQNYQWLIRSCICPYALSIGMHKGWWPWITLNCMLKFKFSGNFVLLRIFGRQ